jgi:hypothetical protein
MSQYALWQYAHLLLFAVWLGALHAQLGVCRYIAREEFPPAQRQHFLELLLRIDLGPRAALILIIPVGFTLAVELGAVPVAENSLAAIWVTCLAWLALNAYLFRRPQAPRATRLVQFDQALRVLLALASIALGLASLVSAGPVHAGWLAAKLTLFGAVVGLDLRWHMLLHEWTAQLAAPPDPAAPGVARARLQASYRHALWSARTLSILLALIAFLGAVKPLLD